MQDHLTSAQIRGARGMLDWSMLDLAKASGVSVSTVKRIEDGRTESTSDEARTLVRRAFETVGMRFLEDEGEGFGLRMQPEPGRIEPPRI